MKSIVLLDDFNIFILHKIINKNKLKFTKNIFIHIITK
jgi:hypothetical protein